MIAILTKLLRAFRTIYNTPGVAHAIDRLVLEYMKGRAQSTKNKVDDKLVSVLEAALRNKNYRAVLNGRGKK